MEYVIRNYFNDLAVVNIEDSGKPVEQKAVFYNHRTWKDAREIIGAYLRKNGFDFIALPEEHRNLKTLTVIPDKKSDIYFANAEIS